MILENLSSDDGDKTKIFFLTKTIALYVRFTSLNISLPSSAKQQREVTKFKVL